MKIQTPTNGACSAGSGLSSEGVELPALVAQSAMILDSYRHWFGKDMINRAGSPEDRARLLFDWDQVVLSCGNEPDPLLNYGNRRALTLWEMSWPDFVRMPARLTAEPMERKEREAFLQQVRQTGFITNYEGVRISRNGRRFTAARRGVGQGVPASRGDGNGIVSAAHQFSPGSS